MTDQSLALSASQGAEWSLGGSIALAFSKSRIASYESAVHAAKRADHYAEGLSESRLLHVAGFGTTRQQLALALFVIQQIRSSKTLHIFAGGKFLQDKWRIEGVLECVLTAASCEDPRAHCTVIVSEEALLSTVSGFGPINIEVRLDSIAPRGAPDRYGLHRVGTRPFPCRLLYERGFKFQPCHPAPESAQIRAGAVRHGCDWCPYLKIETESVPRLAEN